jgi:glyoxylase-like metal-dependent hydrolase (beta-lactamase superfamily II)
MTELKKRGLKKVDAFTPTHYHDDHMTGLPYLVREHGAKLWVFEQMVPHLENPRRELVGCSLPEPFKVDRAIADGERVRWKEYEFTIRYTPGHCDYHMSLFLEHDRQRIVISGDVMFNNKRADSEGVLRPHWNLIYLNKTRAGQHHQSARTIADFHPTVICPGHGRPFAVDDKIMRGFVDETARIAAHLAPFTGARSLDEAMSPHWCQAIPFEQPVRVGAPFGVTVRVTNLRNQSLNGSVSLRTPKDWRVTPDHRHLHVHVGASADLEFNVVALENKGNLPFVAFGINLELDGKDQGEVSQGQVEFV